MKAISNKKDQTNTSASKRKNKIKAKALKALRAGQGGTCSICGRIYVNGGCNPTPVFPVEHRCCHKCDAEVVLPARFYNGNNLRGCIAVLISRAMMLDK